MAVFNINYMSKALSRTVQIMVILPTDKMVFPGMPVREEKPFKTLYLLHGVFGSQVDWLYGTRIQRWAEANDLAVVMPAGENGFYVDQPWNCKYYSKFISEDLVEFTRKSFPLSHKREDTFIGGLSMGGFGAIHNGFKYHETFGNIIALSAALIVNEDLPKRTDDSPMEINTRRYATSCFGPDLDAVLQSDINPKYLVKRLKDEGAELPKVFMACGDKDHLLTADEDFKDYLEELGVDVTWEVGPGNHEWDFWDTYIKKALDWLPLERGVAGMNSGNVHKD